MTRALISKVLKEVKIVEIEELKQSEIDKLENEEFKNNRSEDPQVTPDGPQQDDSLSKKATIIGDKTSIDKLLEYLNNEVQNEENYREIIEIKD